VKPQDQKKIVVEVVQRVLQAEGSNPNAVEQTLIDTMFWERQRLEQEKHRGKAKKEIAFYQRIRSQMLKASPERQRELLAEVIRFFAEEVLGHFSEPMYRVATQIIPVGLNSLLNTLSPLRMIREFPKGLGQWVDQIKIYGEVKLLQDLAKRGVIILVPTHVSNLDSILIGYALYQMGLPPFLYGAGLNLFSNKFLGFFMDHLGAYKVDRKKKAPLYKEVLKTYAGCSMEMGYHNLFFSGGTRSRSGAVEKKIKLGLLGMGLDAYIHNLLAEKSRPDIFVVPCTLNYQLVLEAETLIEDHLKEAGKNRYIIEDDESYQLKRVLEFMASLFSLESRIHVVISPALDLFGNRVDGEGHSRDQRGRVIDRRRYVLKSKVPVFDAQRDQEYTRELGEKIVESFAHDTVIGSVQLVSWVIFKWLLEVNPGMDLYRLLRTGGALESLPLTEAYARFEAAWAAIKKLAEAGQIRLDDTLRQDDPIAIFSEALAHLHGQHGEPVLVRKGDRLFHHNRKLLLYYQNRVPPLEVGT
jgi:glycerol-3-phosphate O-acyltransferase